MKNYKKMKRAIFLLLVVVMFVHCKATKQSSKSNLLVGNIEVNALPSGLQPGPFAVGVKTHFAHDAKTPFDTWGSIYKSDAYKNLLKNIEAAGDVRTVHLNIFYPSNPGTEKAGPENIVPASIWAAKDGRLATEADYYAGNLTLFQQSGYKPNKLGIQRQSYLDASIIEDTFPLVIMLPGFTGGHYAWNRAAAYLSSHGYIVVTVTFISDSRSVAIFEDPDSKYAKTRTAEDLLQDYQLLYAQPEPALFGGFYRNLYGVELDPTSSDRFPDISQSKAITGGGLKSNEMMRAMFAQRTEDLSTTIDEMRKLNLEDNFFKGRINIDNIGVMGHSLGAITSQSALVNIPSVKTAIAFNGGLLKSWEPYGGFPDKSNNPKQPDGVPKDIMFINGSDDDFVHMIYKELFDKWYEHAGGDKTETIRLPGEQVWPTEDNPNPIARNSYERAQTNKLFLIFKDEGHFSLPDFATYIPGEILKGKRVPLSRDVDSFMSSEYEQLGWIEKEGKQVYLPHHMRNYFMTTWFNWQLKGDKSQKEKLLNHPFDDSVKKILHEWIQ